MRGPDGFHEDDEGTVFRDVVLLALAGFLAVLLLVLPHVAKPGERASEESRAPGRVMVEIRRPDDIDADVDLRVKAPGDVPVGYSSRSGLVFDLLRDDLGRHTDPSEVDHEVACGRGRPAGAYAVDVHLHRNASGTFPVPVTVVVSVRGDPRAPMRRLLAERVTLSRVGEERTVFRFRLDADGHPVPGSVHAVPVPLRSAGRA
jgi:hypothetical protein